MRLRDEKFNTLSKGGDPRDVVTSVDLAVNDFLVQKIQEAFPDDSIYSEESAEAFAQTSRLWTIDPIDGSSNFARGIPHFAICIAFLENGVPHAGAVYNPVTNELFSFEKGKSAFLNDKPIHVSEITELKDAFVLLHAGRKPEVREWGGKAYRALLEHAKKTSNLAGSALDTCFVAAGRVEANIYGTLSTLDVAAAVGILTEAGGILVTEQGERAELRSTPQRVIAANSEHMAHAIRTVIF